jgi:DNA invertase Pin-like site-specific DNA recombinase
MPRAAIYARISQNDPNVPKVENQVASCRKIIAGAGYSLEPEDIFSDDGISAFKGKERPGFLDLLTGIEQGRFDVIVAVAEDRFTRSVEEKLAFQHLCTKAHVIWHTGSGVLDPGTAQGGLMALLTGGLAHFESQIKQERIRRSVDDRLAAGKDLGGPRPFGFEVDRLTLRESEAGPLRAAYETILAGGSVRSIARLWTQMGIPRDRGADISSAWLTKSVRNILLRERNCGRLVVKGVTYAEDRPAIVSTETFDAVKAILNNPARAPKRGPEPVTYPGLQSVVCGTCGNSLSIAKTGGVSSYRCLPEGRPGWSRGMAHPTMRVHLFDAHLSSKLFYVIAYAAMTKTKLSALDASIPAMRVQLAELVRQRDIAQQMVYATGANVALALKDVARFGASIEELERQLAQALSKDVATAAVDAAVEALKGVTTINNLPIGQEPQEWLDHWLSLSVRDKRNLTRALLPGARLLRPEAAQQGNTTTVKNRIGRATKKPFKPASAG